MDCHWIRWGRGLALATLTVGACSDDGLSPEQSTSATGGLTAAEGSGGGDGGVVTSDGGGTAGGDGSGGSTGGGETGDTGAPPPGPYDQTCETDRDCKLVNDCCDCTAVNVEVAPTCEIMECDAAACGAFAPGTVCEAGMCTIQWACNPLFVLCDGPVPECPDGTLPAIADGCYTGDCVDAADCDVVPDCSFCADDEACVGTESLAGTYYSCVPLPRDCGGVATCACLPDACTGDGEICVDTDGGVTCTCPAC